MNLNATIDVPCFLGNALYARLTKMIDLPFFPYSGLSIAFKLRAIEGSEDGRKYDALARGSKNSTGIIVVEAVTYYPEGDAERRSLYIRALAAVEEVEPGIAAYVRLMRDYYAFKAELFA